MDDAEQREKDGEVEDEIEHNESPLAGNAGQRDDIEDLSGGTNLDLPLRKKKPGTSIATSITCWRESLSIN